MNSEDTEVLLKDRENQALSKPDTVVSVDRPVRTARIFVHHYNSTQYCNTATFFINIPLPPEPPAPILLPTYFILRMLTEIW